MEYNRTDDGQIKADLANRLGIILKQYREIQHFSEKYEITLCLAILQILLTNCVELLNDIKKIQKHNNPFFFTPIKKEIWGFDESSIITSTFKQPKLNADFIIRQIRNALSHPKNLNLSSKNKLTGYTTRNNSEKIETVVFVSSPDLTNKGTFKTFKTFEAAELYIKNAVTFPDDVVISEEKDNEFIFKQKDEHFSRTIEIELTNSNLIHLTNNLSKYLAHPLKDNWNNIPYDFDLTQTLP